MRRLAVVLVLAALSASCQNNNGIFGPASAGTVRVINASRVPLTVYMDNVLRQETLNVADVATMPVYSGSHQLRVLTANGADVQFSARTFGGALATMVVVGGGSAPLTASAIADTGALVPDGKSKLRVAHLAASGQGVEIWRTQPDFHTPVHIMTPFNYLDTSPYLQSDAGDWEVFITLPGSSSKLATTGPIPIPAGERRTVALLDSAGVLKLRVLGEQ